MIFVTIGTQEPFDRLVKAMDEIAFVLKDIQFVAQVCKTNYKVKNMKALEFISPKEFDNYFNKAELIVSHAGMGTIISALVHEKPIIVVPRLVKFKEHRSDHQIATAKSFDMLKHVHVAYDISELEFKMLALYDSNLRSLHKIGNFASPELIASIKDFIK